MDRCFNEPISYQSNLRITSWRCKIDSSMNPQAFGILEFDQLRQLVRRHAQTDMGRARVATLEPFDDLEPLRHALAEVGEAISLRARGSRFSFDGVADPRSEE